MNYNDSMAMSRRMPPPGNPLIAKLESLATLAQEDRAILEAITKAPDDVLEGVDLIREGDAPNGVYLVLEGLACRYKMRANGARQIMAFLVPGDFCDLDVAFLDSMDHTIGTLSPCKVVRIDLETINRLVRDHPRIARALRLATLVDEATLREWLVNVGCRSPRERIAHLFCELHLRLRVLGRVIDDGFELPVTQADLADTTGLTTVHVARALRDLQQKALVGLSEKHVRILDLASLAKVAEFKPNYLHLGGREAA